MRKTRQQGFTLIEALGSLVVVAIMMAGLVALIDQSVDDSKGQQASLYQAQVTAAATKYIEANYTTLLAAATATTPAKIDIAALKSANLLSNNFNVGNAFGQTPCVLVLRPNADRLEALVVTEGGNDIPVKELSFIASNSGQGGGYISPGDPTNAQGAYNGWKLPLANYTTANCSGQAAAPKRLASAIFFDGPGNLNTDFLYRGAVPGHPELNHMTTPLNMRAIAVEDGTDPAGTVGGCIAGDLTSYGRIAVSGDGAVLSCQAGFWRRQGSRFWRDPVSSYALLPTIGSNVGDVRMVTDPAWPSPRAFTWNGTAWAALAVDQNNNMTVPGTTTTNMLQINQTVVEKTACSPTGLVARDANGLLLSCQGGLWTPQSSTQLGASETDYSVILTSSALTYPPGKVYTGPYAYNAPDDTQKATITRKLVPTKSGMIVVNVWSLMARELVSNPAVIGQFNIVVSIRNDDNNQIIGTTLAKSPLLKNTDAGISTTLSKAVDKNNTGYTVVMETSWSVYEGNQNLYHRSNYKNAVGAIVEQTPLQTGWTIDLFY